MPGLSAWPLATVAAGAGDGAHAAFVGGTAGTAAAPRSPGATAAMGATARAAGFSFGLPQGEESPWESLKGNPIPKYLGMSIGIGKIVGKYEGEIFKLKDLEMIGLKTGGFTPAM